MTSTDTDLLALRARVAHHDFLLDVDCNLPARGVSAIFGPSGCGKTTLLRAVAGLVRPTPGRIVVAGQPWQDDAHGIWLATHQRPLGMVFQEASLFEHLSVRANLDFGRNRVPSHERKIPLERAIELLGIGHLLGRQPARLSGGERQRVAIARALATSPRLLLMDEPLAALDAARKAELLPWFERLTRELDIPMLYVTHALDEVARLADHLLLLDAGRVRARGPTRELFTSADIARTHGDQAGTLIEGWVQSFEPEHHLMAVAFDGGTLWCVQQPKDASRRHHDRLRLRILARDVSLTLGHTADTSILNVLPATVTAISDDGPAQQLITLTVGTTPMLARITRKSSALLGLAVGQSLHAQIKAVAVLD